MTISVPASGARTPRAPGVTRAYGQATVLARQGGLGLVPAAAATVTPYVAGTGTPYTAPLYAAAADTAPVVFPLLTGDDGVVALWSDTPVRLDLVASAPGLGQAGVPLDLELPPGAVDPASPYLTQDEGDARYLPIGYTPPPVDLSSYYTKPQANSQFVDVAGDTMTGALAVGGTVTSQGGGAGLVFQGRDAGAGFMWYATGGTAYLYNLTTGAQPLALGATGTLTLSPTAPQDALRLNGAASTNRFLRFQSSGVDRWAVFADGTPEAGSTAGSNLIIGRYDDTGAYLGALLDANRATGAATFGGDVSVDGNALHLTNPAQARITADTVALRLNATGANPILFENTGGAMGQFSGTDYHLKLNFGLDVTGNAALTGGLTVGAPLTLTGQTTGTTATVGTASALPGVPAGYLSITINGSVRRLAYWNP